MNISSSQEKDELDVLMPATTTEYRSAEASSRRIRTLQHYIDAAGI